MEYFRTRVQLPPPPPNLIHKINNQPNVLVSIYQVSKTAVIVNYFEDFWNFKPCKYGLKLDVENDNLFYRILSWCQESFLFLLRFPAQRDAKRPKKRTHAKRGYENFYVVLKEPIRTYSFLP